MCRIRRVVDKIERDAERVVGEECHSVSAAKNGPRHDPTCPSDALRDEQQGRAAMVSMQSLSGRSAARPRSPFRRAPPQKRSLLDPFHNHEGSERMHRRDFIRTLSLAVTGIAMYPRTGYMAELRADGAFSARMRELETQCGGRLGVAVHDLSSGKKVGYRQDERFAMCSTFKFLLTAAVLQRVDTGNERLARLVRIPEQPLISNSPLTEKHAGGEMSIDALCHASMTRSDNTAANLLLETLDGPAGVTGFARSIGDRVTRLDRTETALNEAAPGDPRDTTSPEAMLANLERILVGSVLSAAAREKIIAWMEESKTGGERLRAHVPQGWRAGDKSGSNLETTSNDIGIFWPPGRSAVLVTAYLTECPGPETKRSAVLAEIGRHVVSIA